MASGSRRRKKEAGQAFLIDRPDEKEMTELDELLYGECDLLKEDLRASVTEPEEENLEGEEGIFASGLDVEEDAAGGADILGALSESDRAEEADEPVDLAVEESSEAEELKEARRYMKIRDIIEQRGNSLSFEFFPPKTQEAETHLFDAIKRLEIFRPSFVSVTYGAGGGTRETTRHVVERIVRETSLTPMPHLTCIGQSEDELRAILRDYQQLGIENLFALRGDPPKGTAGSPADNGHCHASDLVRLASSFDAFSIGVAVYPEGHVEAPSLETDMFYTKEKVEADADFAITQMFFDNRSFYDFMERAEKVGIRIPIIPGIMPITDIGKVKEFCQMCGTSLPPSLVDRMENAGSSAEVERIGIDFATRQCDDLWQNGVRFFHFYTLNRADSVTEVLHNLSLERLLGETSEEDLTSSILVT